MPTQGQLYRFPSYWQSPEVGEFKLNCNGMITSGGESTYGGVLWDEKGKVDENKKRNNVDENMEKIRLNLGVFDLSEIINK